MKIEIITTNLETVKEPGFGTMKECKSVLKSLQKKYKNARLNICESELDLVEVANRKPDLIISAVRYIPLENDRRIWLSDFFGKLDINFTGSKRDALELGGNKMKTNKLMAEKGVRTVDCFLVTSNTFRKESELPISFPLFIKPIDTANSNGIDEDSLAYNFSDYSKKTENILLKYNNIALVEKYLSGREFTVGVIEDTINDELIVSSIEIIPPQNKNGIRILDRKVKKDKSARMVPVTDTIIKKELEKIAIDTFLFIGACDYARIDIKMDEFGVCYLMDVNLVPGMTEKYSYFPRAFEIENKFDYNEVVNLIVDNALSRTAIDKASDL